MRVKLKSYEKKSHKSIQIKLWNKLYFERLYHLHKEDEMRAYSIWRYACVDLKFWQMGFLMTLPILFFFLHFDFILHNFTLVFNTFFVFLNVALILHHSWGISDSIWSTNNWKVADLKPSSGCCMLTCPWARHIAPNSSRCCVNGVQMGTKGQRCASNC